MAHAPKSVELLIEPNFLPSEILNIDGANWKFTIQKSVDFGMFLQLECLPMENCQYWESRFSFVTLGVSKNHEEVKQLPVTLSRHFSNYSTTSPILRLDDNMTGLKIEFNCEPLSVCDFPKLFDELYPNISDIKLIVEGQEIYACKKILAIYSKFFYNLFNEEYEDDGEIEQFPIPGASCNSFRVFLGLLYGQYNSLTATNIESVAELSFRFNAEHCLEECEKFLINSETDMHQGVKLKLAHIYNFEKLQYLVLSNVHTFEETMEMDDYISFDELGSEVELMIFDRMTQMQRREKPVELELKYEERSTSFTKRDPYWADMTLSVGDKKFYVSKQLLAYHSAYFNALFYSNFYEKGRDKIELKEIDANEFEMFLQFVYHPNRVITNNLISDIDNQYHITVGNVEALLKLSQMYDVQTLLHNCIEFLKFDDTMNDGMKINIAMKYHVQELIDHVIAKLSSIKNRKELLRIPGFDILDKATIVQIGAILWN